jgi:hypothetical protein
MLTTDPLIITEEQDKTFNPASLFLCWFRTQMRRSTVNHKRVCVLCAATKSRLSKSATSNNFYEHWYYDQKGNDLCCNCYMKKYFEEYKKRIYNFKGKAMIASKAVRKGICSWCKRILDKKNVRRTSLHHTKYDKHDPLKYTIEICNRCHTKLKKKHPDAKRICFDCGSNKTRIEIDKGMSEHWYFLDLDSNKFLCNKCYCKRKRRHLLANH